MAKQLKAMGGANALLDERSGLLHSELEEAVGLPRQGAAASQRQEGRQLALRSPVPLHSSGRGRSGLSLSWTRTGRVRAGEPNSHRSERREARC
jgi:hypothetical protein